MEKICRECGATFTTDRRAREYCPGRRCSNKAIARAREQRKQDVPTSTVWSCGGGVQSTAIAVLIADGRIPKPDYAVMTDVGYEKQSTWEYAQAELIPRLASIGVKLHIIKTADYTSNRIVDGQGGVRIPAYKRGNNGQCIKYHTHCSGPWKGAVARRWMREQGVQRAINWIGISADEARRTRSSPLKWVDLRYPLVDLGISRELCLWLIAQAGWPRPPRTSCYICPLQDDTSWLRTKMQYPEDWARAVAIEQEIRTADPDVYLHQSLVPLEHVEFRFGWMEMQNECNAPGVTCWG